MPGWMRASALEFRLRYLVHALVFTLGLWAPWTYLYGAPTRQVGANAHVWGVGAAYLAKLLLGPAQIVAGFNLILVVGIALAGTAAFLRTWGTAYLGARVVGAGMMEPAAATPDGVLEAGPFRFIRNPLYVGTFLYALALTMLMTVSGAVFTVAVIGLMQVRLVGGEERFLAGRLGSAYEEYCERVPRWLPRVRGVLRRGPTHDGEAVMNGARGLPGQAAPRWGQAFLAEVAFWGVTAGYAFLGWRYNTLLLIECVVVSFGVSLVTRAFVVGGEKV